MRLLLDTNILLFTLMDDRRLSAQSRRSLSEEAVERHVSIVSIWEIALKASAGKLDLDAHHALAALPAANLTLLPLEPAHVLAFEGLPRRADHRDPFDRLLLAQAKAEGLTFMTSDRDLAAYGVPLIAA